MAELHEDNKQLQLDLQKEKENTQNTQAILTELSRRGDGMVKLIQELASVDMEMAARTPMEVLGFLVNKAKVILGEATEPITEEAPVQETPAEEVVSDETKG